MTFTTTRRACYTGYVTQAIVNNLAPLLFIVFQTHYAVSIERLGRLVLLNFATQLLTDIVAVKYVDRWGYRGSLVAAHVFALIGLVTLAIAPAVLPSPYVGLCAGVILCAIGGGLLEVMVSPVVEHLPSPQTHKAAAMALLHSFYCWGQVAVVAGTTLILAQIGQTAWQALPLVWAMVPLVNLVIFLRVPMPPLVAEHERIKLRELFSSRAFLAMLVLMFAAGSVELVMVQWSSLFAERGLGVSKVTGDLLGPCLFAVLMGIGRILYGLGGHKIALPPALAICGVACTVCYLTVAFASHPLISLLACAFTGLAASLLWPGTFSLSAARFPLGGAAMFGVLAVFGDLGGALGPWLTGVIADASARASTAASARPMMAALADLLPSDATGLRVGILAGTIVPVVMTITAVAYAVTQRRRRLRR
jgi:fucose permease